MRILPFDNFRRAEPKRRCSHHIHQIWAYATKRRLASLLLHFSAWLILQHYAIWRVWKSNENGQLFFWSELKQLFTYSPIHLFTYSPIHFLEIKSKKWTAFSCCELKQLFTYSPIRLLPRSFRRIEPKGYRRVYGRQNWAYAAKMRLASSLIQFYLTWNEESNLCASQRPHYPQLLNKQCRNSVGATRCSEPIASGWTVLPKSVGGMRGGPPLL
jgi:hypothetical protein